jgi:hypothetical protein
VSVWSECPWPIGMRGEETSSPGTRGRAFRRRPVDSPLRPHRLGGASLVPWTRRSGVPISQWISRALSRRVVHFWHRASRSLSGGTRHHEGTRTTPTRRHRQTWPSGSIGDGQAGSHLIRGTPPTTRRPPVTLVELLDRAQYPANPYIVRYTDSPPRAAREPGSGRVCAWLFGPAGRHAGVPRPPPDIQVSNSRPIVPARGGSYSPSYVETVDVHHRAETPPTAIRHRACGLDRIAAAGVRERRRR